MFRNRALGIGLSLLIVAVPAAAQESAVRYPPACDSSQVTKADVDRAHSVFLSGKQFLEESNYDKAIGYFADAYSIDCSIHAILPIIATAYERKGDKAEAIRALEEYLRRAPDAADHEIIEHRIKNLKDQLAHESAPAPPGAPTPPPPTTPPPTPAAPAANGAPSAAPPPAAESSAAPSVAPPVATSAPPPSERRHGAAPWIAVGAGGVAVATGVVLYVVGAGLISSALNTCGGSRACRTGNNLSLQAADNAVDQGNRGRTLETAGGVVGSVGLAAAAAGLIWHFTEKPATATAGAIRPIFAPGYVGATGVF